MVELWTHQKADYAEESTNNWKANGFLADKNIGLFLPRSHEPTDRKGSTRVYVMNWRRQNYLAGIAKVVPHDQPLIRETLLVHESKDFVLW
jgi:hypothetical protein